MAPRTETTWYTVVGFGPIPGKGGAYTSRDEAQGRINRAMFADAANAWGGVTGDLRIYGYRTRRQARAGDISDQVGRSGRVV